jgi:O6-methylguanine-DNA--protein-cysteine methyltransferase
VRPTLVQYEAKGWGVGELWLDGACVLWSELPRPRDSCLAPGARHDLTDRLKAWFAGAADDFADVELDLDDGFYGDCAHALRAVPRGEVVTQSRIHI